MPLLVIAVALGVAAAIWILPLLWRAHEAERKLRRICLNDAAQAARLIDYELRRGLDLVAAGVAAGRGLAWGPETPT